MIDRRRLDVLVQKVAVAQRHTEAEITQFELAGMYRRIFQGPDGEAVLADICYRLCGLGGHVWHVDAAIMGNNAVRRDLAEQILHLVLGDIQDDKPEVRK